MEPGSWQFPQAEFDAPWERYGSHREPYAGPRLDVQAFLRGPRQKVTTHRMPISECWSLCERYSNPIKCSYTLTPVKVNLGAYSYVTVTKTAAYFPQRDRRGRELVMELLAMLDILDNDAGHAVDQQP